MNEKDIRAVPQAILQVVCDGIYLYAACSDGTIWVSRLEFPLAWTLLVNLPSNEGIHSIGVTLGAVKNLPDDVFYVVTDKGSIFFWDGTTWTQQWPLPS